MERRILLITPLVGLAVAGLAIAFAAATGKGSAEVLFSGQDQLGPFIQHSASYTVGALLLLIACKGLAYGISLSSFRGGPTFPALFLGGVGGVALSHLPGLPLVAGVAMGIGAMSVVMLRLPLTSVLLASLLLASDGLAVMPLVIVAVVVAYVLSARLAPTPAKSGDPDRLRPATREPQPAGRAATPGAPGSHPGVDHRSSSRNRASSSAMLTPSGSPRSIRRTEGESSRAMSGARGIVNRWDGQDQAEEVEPGGPRTAVAVGPPAMAGVEGPAPVVAGPARPPGRW